MLRRVNSGLFEAPPGAEIQVVVDSQGNNGVNAAEFEYAGEILPGESILGLPGCTFTVDSRERLEVGVVFDPGAPGSARYDLFEVENGVRSSLQKFVRNSDPTPLMSFTIDPVAEDVAAAGPAVAPRAGRKAAKRKAAKRKGGARKARKTAKKKTAAGTRTRRRSTVKRKRPPKRTARTRSTSRKRTK